MPAIRVELELVDGTFTSRLIHAGQTVKQFNETVSQASPALAAMADKGQLVIKSLTQLEGHSKSFLSTFRDITTTAASITYIFGTLKNAASGFLGQIVQVNSDVEKLRVLLGSMSTSKNPFKEAGDQVKYLRDMALNAPFTLRGLTETFVRMKSTGIDPMNGSMQSLVDAVAAFGGTDQVMERAALAIQQMSGKGVIQMEELRQQLGEAIPRATELMARGMGVSYSQLVQSISTGRVKAQPALKAMFEEFQRTFGGRAVDMMQTFSGQWSQMITNLQNAALAVGDAGYFDAVKDQLKDVNEYLRSTDFAALAKDLGQGLATAVGAIRSAIDWVVYWREELTKTAEVMASVFVATRVVSGISAIVAGLRNAGAAIALTKLQFAALGAEAKRTYAAMSAASVESSIRGGLSSIASALMWTEKSAKQSRLAIAGVSTAFNAGQLSQFNSALDAMRFRTTVAGRGVSAFTSTVSVMGRTLGAAKFALSGLATAIGFVNPWLAVLGVGLLTAADYFGWFTSSADKALSKVKEFGAESKAELSQAFAELADQKKQVDALVAERETTIAAEVRNREGQLGGPMPDKEAFVEAQRAEFDAANDLAGKKKALADTEAALTKAGFDLDKRMAIEASRVRMDAIEDEIRANRRKYDIKAKELVDDYDKQRAQAERSGRQQETVTQNYQTRLRRLRIKSAQDTLDALEKYYDEEKALSKDSDPVKSSAALRVIDELLPKLKEAREELHAAKAPVTGVEFTVKSGDFEKTLKKGQDLLEKLRANAVGLQADLAGATGEVDKLVYQLLQGKYGDPLNGKVKELISQLVQAQDEVETLQDAMKGKNKLDTDIENARQKAYERYYDALLSSKKGDLTDVQKIQIKLETGYYGPVANNPMVAQMEGMRTKIAAVKEEARAAGRSLDSSLIGGDPQRNAKLITERLQDMLKGWGDVNKAIKDSPLGKLIDLYSEQADAAKTTTETIVAANDDQTKSVERAGDVIQNTILASSKKSPLVDTIDEIRAGMQGVRKSATDAGAAITSNVFGASTQTGMSTVLDLVGQLKTAWTNLNGVIKQSPLMALISGTGSAIGALVSNIQSLVGFGYDAATGGSAPYKTQDPVAPELTPVEKALLNAIAGPESGGAYNVRYAPDGAKTFDPTQGHPRIYEPTDNGKVSSAAGRYQFTAETFDWLKGTSFLPADQDRLALELAKREYQKNGGNDLLSDLQVNGLTQEILAKIAPRWEGLKDHPKRAIATYNETYGRSVGKLLPGEQSKVDETNAVDAAAKNLEGHNLVANLLDELKSKTEDLEEATDGYGTHVKRIQDLFAKGKFGPDVTKESADYKELIKAAEEADKREKEINDRKKLRNKFDSATSALDAKEKEFRDKAEEYARQLDKPGSFKNDNAYYSLKKQLDEYVEYAKQLYNKDDENSKRALDDAINYRKSLLSKYQNTELLKFAGDISEKNQSGAQALMTDADRRKAMYDQEISVLNDFLEKVRASETLTGDQRVQIERQVIERKRQLNEQYNQDGPIAQQMKQWGDFGKNFESATAGWMDSFADNLATLITTGKADFKGLANSIISDFAKMAIKWATSSIYKSLFSGAGGNKTSKAAGAGAKTSKGLNAAGGAGPLDLGALMGGFADGGSIVGPGTETSDSIMTWLSNGEYLVNAKSAKKWRPVLEAMNDNGAAAAKKIKAFRKGGKISGEGTGTSDSILVKVSNGEFVVKAAATAKYFNVLEAINNDALSGMNLPKFATGGLVGANDSKGQPVTYGDRSGGDMGASHISQPISISSNVTVNATGGSHEQNADLAKQVSKSVEGNIRQLVTSEMMKQMRPGGLLRQGARR